MKLAGPAVIVSLCDRGAVHRAVMWALAEMAAEHPVAGSFGVYAEIYLHPWAGFAMRYTYWLAWCSQLGAKWWRRPFTASIGCRFRRGFGSRDFRLAGLCEYA